MDMTGWLQGQVFVQTVDEHEVEAVTGFLKARGLNFQVLTLSERMVLDQADPRIVGVLGPVQHRDPIGWVSAGSRARAE